MHIARQLLTMGYLKQEGEYHTLSLTAKALEALKKRAIIMGVVQEPAERVKKAGKRKEEIEYNNALFALLRQKRKELADEAGVPPYVIFSDRTLIEMAAYYPQSITHLLTISGVGQVKLRQYGEPFLEVIKTYCEKHGLKENPKEATREKSDSNRRYVIVAEAYNAGETIQSLMERYQVTAGTIIEHLSRYLAAGNKLRNDGDFGSLMSITLEQHQDAFSAFDELGLTFLKPVYDRLNGALNYDDLKILRLLYMISH
jgi:ATP-dependent DNA helicase RecQ